MDWTQPSHLTDEEIDTLLEKINFAKFWSMNPDGTIHAVPVSYKYENGKILITTPINSRKARNIKRNRSATVLVDVAGQELSDFKWVIVYGQAKVIPVTIEEMMLVGEIWIPVDKVEIWSKALLKFTDWAMIIVVPQSTASFDIVKDIKFAAAIQE